MAGRSSALSKLVFRAFAFLSKLATHVQSPAPPTLSTIRSCMPSSDRALLDTAVDEFNDYIVSCKQYVKGRRLNSGSLFFVNGVAHVFDSLVGRQAFQQRLIRIIYLWQHAGIARSAFHFHNCNLTLAAVSLAVRDGLLNDDTDLERFMFDADDVVQVQSDVVAVPKSSHKYVGDYHVVAAPSGLRYVSEGFTTVWVNADLDTDLGARIAFNAVQFAIRNGDVRLAFVFPTSVSADGQASDRYVHGRYCLLLSYNIVFRLTSVNWVVASLQNVQDIARVLAVKCSQSLWSPTVTVEHALSLVLGSDAALRDDLPSLVASFPDPAVVVDGRVFGPLSRPLDISEFGVVLQGRQVIPDDIVQDNAWLVRSILGCRARDSSVQALPALPHGQATSLRFPSPSSSLSVTAVIDPLSETAQKLAPVLLALRKDLHWDITLVINPTTQATSVPIQRFYRYVFRPTLEFLANGARDHR